MCPVPCLSLQTYAADGKEVYYFAEAQTTHTAMKDGTQLYEFPNGQVCKAPLWRWMCCSRRIRGTGGHSTTDTWGALCRQIEKHVPNGQKEIRYPDGTTKSVFSNGEMRSKFPDGTELVEFPDGRKVAQTPRGGCGDWVPWIS